MGSLLYFWLSVVFSEMLAIPQIVIINILIIKFITIKKRNTLRCVNIYSIKSTYLAI